ncbi:MAG: hypothetical protein K8I30_13245 [Anaerolineae bacterium]|nr:hypothetical protein [Anaerolineae bacterium]
MTKPLSTPEPFDARRLPEGQLDWVRSAVEGYIALVEALSPDERNLYAGIWRYLARNHAPATSRQFNHLHLAPVVVSDIMEALNERKLLWYDNDLRAVLQCAPFSVLHTPHQVKVFGWERIYASSFIDIPITLMVYGPNTWLSAQSICPRSGETLAYKIKMREDFTLQADPPREASRWRIWMPAIAQAESEDEPYLQFHRLRSKINAFNSDSDLDMHREYTSPDDPGVVYTFEQAMYLSSLFLVAYLQVAYTV